MKEEIYDIGGMHCAACSAAVERVTKKLPGVRESSVNLPMNRLTISYDEKLCSPEAIVKKIEKAGFTATLHEKEKKEKKPEASKELRKEKTSLIVSAVFAGTLLVLSMGHMLIPGFPLPALFSPDTHPVNLAVLELLLTIPVLFLGRRFFTGGFTSLLHGNPNMDTLVALSASASFLYSLVITFMLTDNPGLVHSLYYESAAVVVALVSVGKYLEAKNQAKTKDAITALMKLAPDKALLLEGDAFREVPASSVKVGDVLLVQPGERVPLDGVLIKGRGSFNEAMLTGESMPVDKDIGGEAVGGSVLLAGAVQLRVTRVGEDTTLARIIRFVEDAQGKKAPIARAADKVAGVFVPAVLAVAFLAAAVWLLLGKPFSFALNIFTSVLVIACPCAMGLATPTAIIVGTGLGASKGILIRSGEALEKAHKITVAVFDKTGTLTEGKMAVTELIAEEPEEYLKCVWALESLSKHPLAAALCEEAKRRGVANGPGAEDFINVDGKGLRGVDTEGRSLLAGSPAFMEEQGFSTEAFQGELKKLQGQGKTAVFAARDGKLLGFAAIADTLRESAAPALKALKDMGVKTVLLTGDNRAAAAYVGALAGAEEIKAEVLPTEKAAVISDYQRRGYEVLMVGDGINDAPALVQADVGCAIGRGSDVAIDAADIVLMGTELTDVPKAVKLSRLTIKNIRQNLFWAFCYNTLGIPIAAGILYPAFHLLLSPMIGALAMSLSSLFVVTNALRLRSKKL